MRGDMQNFPAKKILICRLAALSCVYKVISVWGLPLRTAFWCARINALTIRANKDCQATKMATPTAVCRGTPTHLAFYCIYFRDAQRQIMIFGFLFYVNRFYRAYFVAAKTPYAAAVINYNPGPCEAHGL